MTFHRQGLGYVQPIPSIAALIKADRIKRSSDGLHAELTVESAVLDRTNTRSGHLNRSRENLSSSVALTRLAGKLAKRVPADWDEILGEFAKLVLEAESQGEPVIMVGNLPRRQSSKYAVFPLCSAGDTTILFGDGEAGKSFFALGIAYMVRTGASVIPDMRADKGVPLYLDWETTEYEIDERIKQIARFQRVDPPDIPYRRMAGPITDHVETLAGVIAELGVTFLVVDSFEMAMAGGENRDANDSVIRFFSAMRTLGTTALVLDHINKNDADRVGGATKPYGSIYKHNMARSTWELRRDIDYRILTNRKSNNDRFDGSLAYQYVFADGGVSFVSGR